MNVKLLRKIQKAILAEPRRFEMTRWVQKVEANGPDDPPCGTTACIAGFADMLTNPEIFLKSLDNLNLKIRLQYRAQAALKISNKQATKLFETWPGYNRLKTPMGRAKWAVRKIERFIKSNGAQ